LGPGRRENTIEDSRHAGPPDLLLERHPSRSPCLLGVKWSGCAALTVAADPDSMGGTVLAKTGADRCRKSCRTKSCRGPSTCIRRIGIRSASGVSARSSDGVRGGLLDHTSVVG
jgi:hypothetical protein